MRGLARHPHQRWESVQAFATAFEQAALSALPVLTQTVSRNQVVAASSMEQHEDDPGPTPPPAAIRMTASVPAAMPASAPEDELTDELSQKFFAEGEAQQAAHTVPQAVYRGQQQPNHPSMRRAMAFEPTEAVSSARVPTGRRPRLPPGRRGSGPADLAREAGARAPAALAGAAVAADRAGRRRGGVLALGSAVFGRGARLGRPAGDRCPTFLKR